MNYCPKCSQKSLYYANGSEVIIKCRLCGEMIVRFRGTPYLHSNKHISCPFCGGCVHRHKIGDYNEIIWFCETCIVEFVLQDKEKKANSSKTIKLGECIYAEKHLCEEITGITAARYCTYKGPYERGKHELKCTGKERCSHFTTSKDEVLEGEG